MKIWKIDPSHSEVQFKVKHLMISTVTGSFGQYDASLESPDEGFENSKVRFTAKIDSITTGNEQRDGHLKSGDFFESETYPELKFESTSFDAIGDDEYFVKGLLTIKGTSKEIELIAEYGGVMTDFYGQEKVGFDIKGKINRKEFGLAWDAVTEAGGVVVSDEVKLIMNVQFGKQ